MKLTTRVISATIMACGLWPCVARAEVLAEYTYDPGANFNPDTQGWTLGAGTEEDVNFFNSGGTSLLIQETTDPPNVLFTETVPTNVFFDAWSFTGENRFAGNSQEEFGMFMFVDDGTNLWHMSFYNHGNDDTDGIYMGGDPEGPVLGVTATKVWAETVGGGPGGTVTNKPFDGFLDWSIADPDGAGGASPRVRLEGVDLDPLVTAVPELSRFPAGTVGWGSLNPNEAGFFQTKHMVFDGNPNAEPPLLNGDYNIDGKVDGADYVTWRDNEGGGTALPNDNNLGTPIGAAHYNLWRANFGNMAGSGAGLAGGAVPEPSSQLLLILSGVLIGITRGTTQQRRQHGPRHA